MQVLDTSTRISEREAPMQVYESEKQMLWVALECHLAAFATSRDHLHLVI